MNDGAGSTLRDVTEAVGLVANERSLLCACLADRLLVQVMHKRMQLCSMEAVLAPDQGWLVLPPCLQSLYDSFPDQKIGLGTGMLTGPFSSSSGSACCAGASS